jgi:hypothetical protein
MTNDPYVPQTLKQLQLLQLSESSIEVELLTSQKIKVKKL